MIGHLQCKFVKDQSTYLIEMSIDKIVQEALTYLGIDEHNWNHLFTILDGI
jgi:hypothetical protein